MASILNKSFESHKKGDFLSAIKGYRKFLKKEKSNIAVQYLLAEALYKSNNIDQSVSHLQDILKNKPDMTQASTLLASIYQIRQDHIKALEVAKNALQYGASTESLMLIYAQSSLMAGHYKDAQTAFESIISQNPEQHVAYNGLGSLFQLQGNHKQALPYFEKTVVLKPDYAEGHNNVGTTLMELGDLDNALIAYDQAIELQPGYVKAIGNKASIVRREGRFEEAVSLYKYCLKDDRKHPNMHSNYLMCLHYMDNMPREEIYKAHLQYDEKYCKHLAPKTPRRFKNTKEADRPLRIGMVSSNFARHPVGYMILPALDHMDKSTIQFFAYSDLIDAKKDDFTQRIQGNCEVWHDTNGLPDAQLMAMIEDDQIDILLDLTGHAEGGNRLSVFASRAAPVQAEWIGGLFDTSGLLQMDWIIGDKIEIPEGDDQWYTERVYRMPDDYICYEPPDYADDIKPLPALTNGYITFGNLNNPSKINDTSLHLWANVMAAVPDSKMLFSSRAFERDSMKARILETFKSHGIGDDRIIFEYGGPHSEYLKTYHKIDIALDPYPYSGGLTTCEALWMGVPVMAYPGETFAGLHAATHLYNAGLPDWIIRNKEAYVAWAQKWADDINGLSTLRQSLRTKVAKSPLIDGPRFAKNLERAFKHMWSTYLEE